jgi:hypothetical protein
MAVTGVFTADFSNFDKAVTDSQAKLSGFEGASKQVESSLRLMTQSQEQFLDKIGASGGKIQDLGKTATTTGGQVNTLSESYRQFDGLLQAAGVNIGPQVKGLEDMASAAGKTATELGVLGTAGLVAGAALTGWKIGTWIGEITGATDAIANLGGALDHLAEQTAGAKQDTINLAISKGAAETIKYADAIKYLSGQVQVNADKSINWREKLADSYRELRGLTDAQKEEIAIALEAGATTEQLTNKYGIHATALGLLKTETDKATAAQEKLNAERQKDLEAAEKRKANNEAQLALMERDARLAADRAKFDAEQLEITNQKMAAGKGYVEQMGQMAARTKELGDAEAARLSEQDALTAANDALAESLDETAVSHEAAGAAAAQGTALATAGYQAVTQAVEVSGDAIRAWIELMQYTAEANAILSQNGLYTSGAQYENIARIGSPFGGVPKFAGGIENFTGGLAKVHGGEVLANLPPGTSVFPRGQGLGATVNNTFNLVDSESNLARRVAELIMRNVRAGTQLGTA